MNRKRRVCRGHRKGSAKKRRRSKSRKRQLEDENTNEEDIDDQIRTKFLNYDEISNYLQKVAEEHRNKIRLQTIGTSEGGKSIYMVMVSLSEDGFLAGVCRNNDDDDDDGGCTCPCNLVGEYNCNADYAVEYDEDDDENRMIAFIESGSNGCDWMAVSSALYIIDYLMKEDNLPTAMDFYIVPCSNPDAYQDSFSPGHKLHSLTYNYPITLGESDITKINNSLFNKTIMRWKEDFRFGRPENTALINTICKLQHRIKLFVSLQEGAVKPKILFPFGSCDENVSENGTLAEIAKMAGREVKGLSFEVGSMYNVCGLTFGSILDYMTATTGIVFTYVMHINNRLQKPDEGKIVELGQNIAGVVISLSKSVTRFYVKPSDTNVRNGMTA